MEDTDSFLHMRFVHFQASKYPMNEVDGRGTEARIPNARGTQLGPTYLAMNDVNVEATDVVGPARRLREK